MRLIRYREAQDLEPLFLWVDDEDRTVSPYFESEEAATDWARRIYDRPLCSFVTEANWSYSKH